MNIPFFLTVVVETRDVKMKSTILLLVALLLRSFAAAAADDLFEDRLDLVFRVKAVYRGDGIRGLGLRGSGLGLSWTACQPMTSSSEEDGVWTFDVVYKSDLLGYRCMNCSDVDDGFVANGDDLKLGFWAEVDGSEAEVAMVGASFRIPLPVSKVSPYFDQKPEFVFYPYFFKTGGNFETVEVQAEDESIGSRNMAVYLPPGFLENTRPVYDVYYVLDLSPDSAEMIQGSLDRIFVDGVAHDAILVGHGDWKDDEGFDRTLQLTPAVGVDFKCKEGTFDDWCNWCLPWETTYLEYIYWMSAGGCGITVEVGGNADANVDFLLNEVYSTVNSYLNNAYGSGLTDSREGTFIFGYSFGGLISCHAVWTRPESFGGAGCQSASFGWPLQVDDAGNGFCDFQFENVTLKSHLNDRLPQNVVIDVGSAEEDALYQSVSSAGRIFDTMNAHPVLASDKNLWLSVYPDEPHTNESWLKRVWNIFKILGRGRN